MRRVTEGWYLVSRLSGIEHRLLFRETLDADVPYSADLPLDRFFELRTHAARRLWRSLDGRPPGPVFRALPVQRRRRLMDSLRALDAHLDGASYRVIAEVLFGPDRIRGSDWKTHELRNQTIRLAQTGLTLMRGGYRDLLTYPFKAI